MLMRHRSPLHASLLLLLAATNFCCSSSLPVPCPISRPGATCGCSSYSTMPSSYDWTRNYPEEVREDEAYTYVDDMAFRKPKLQPHQQRDQGTGNRTAVNPELNPDFWPGGIIFYLLDEAFSSAYRDSILAALNEIESRVGRNHLEFRPARTKSGRLCRKGYLHVVKTEREQCIAEVGMQRSGLTKVWLNQKSCLPGTIQHELLHSLGRYHEQCRPDRDEFVTLQPENMVSTECSNYVKVSSAFPNPSIQLPYDSYSIMHYGSCYFTCNGKYTMLRKDGSEISANRQSMTAWDVEKLRVMYPTDAKVPYSDKFCAQCGQHTVSGLGVVILTAVLALTVTNLPS